LTLDFGFVPIVSVGDFVWLDTNGDGVQDSGEPGLAGVTVSLYDADETLLATTVTDANGNYLFTGLPPGVYTVGVLTPDGFAPTISGAGTTATDSSTGSATSAELTTAGASDLTLDFGFVPIVSVGDFVWLDTNGDGVQDSGEPGLAGVTVTITTADGAPVTDVFGNPVTTAVTDQDGKYLFKDLPVGQYTVTVSTPVGYVPTVEGAGTTATDSSTGSATSSLLMTGGASDLTLDFGFVPLVAVGNFVWIDTNGDGLQDAGELGLAGVVVVLFDPDSGEIARDVEGNEASAVTDSDGFYLIDKLLPGAYYATFTLPNGYVFTTVLAGGDSKFDSDAVRTDANPLVGETAVFTIHGSATGDTVAVSSPDWMGIRTALLASDLEVADNMFVANDPSLTALFINPTIDAGVVVLVDDDEDPFDAQEIPEPEPEPEPVPDPVGDDDPAVVRPDPIQPEEAPPVAQDPPVAVEPEPDTDSPQPEVDPSEDSLDAPVPTGVPAGGGTPQSFAAALLALAVLIALTQRVVRDKSARTRLTR
jgi:protocatechuate 3,4-dioxygenase beta subunit